MGRVTDSRCVLAVRDLAVSTRYYIDVLGFRREPIDAEGWSFLTRDNFKVMLGECPDEKPASEIGNHSYVVYLYVDSLDSYYEEVTARGAAVLSVPEDKPWGLREFVLRTPDGHRMTCGEPIARR